MFHTKIVMFNNMVIMDRWKFSRCTLCSITKLLINCHIMSSWESFIENRWILNMAYFVLNVISMISPFSPHSNATTTAKFYKCIRNSHFTRNSQIGVCCKLESIGINCASVPCGAHGMHRILSSISWKKLKCIGKWFQYISSYVSMI